jgi:hypothetical protein
MLNPLICGTWDGCSAWLQWTPLDSSGAAEYEIELRYRRTGNDPWGGWMRISPRQGPKSIWAVVPTWKEGWQCQARVRVKTEEAAPEANWELASEVTFTRCSALFEFSSSKYDAHFHAGTVFHSQVDGAACAYELKEELEVKIGVPARTRMEATGTSGYFQLDHAGHFIVRPSFGVVIQNIEPSVEDVQLTGRDYTEIKPKEGLEILTLSVGAVTKY